MIRSRLPLALVPTILLAAPAPAQDDSADQLPTRLELSGGDTITGVIVDRNDDEVLIDHPTLGYVSVPAGDVENEIALSADGTPIQEAEEIPEEDPWSGSVDVGLNGSSGNTDRFNFRASVQAQREADLSRLNFSAIYLYGEEEGNETENRFFSELRHDWLFEGEKLFAFADARFEADEFKDYDQRISGHVGLGYEFIKEEDTTLTGRIGVGAAREFGGTNDDVIPEGIAAIDFTQAFNENVRFATGAEFLPDFSDNDNFRVNAYANLEVDLNNAKTWRLRLGVEDRFDNQPEDAESNDFYYFLSLAYTF